MFGELRVGHGICLRVKGVQDMNEIFSMSGLDHALAFSGTAFAAVTPEDT